MKLNMISNIGPKVEKLKNLTYGFLKILRILKQQSLANAKVSARQTFTTH